MENEAISPSSNEESEAKMTPEQELTAAKPIADSSKKEHLAHSNQIADGAKTLDATNVLNLGTAHESQLVTSKDQEVSEESSKDPKPSPKNEDRTAEYNENVNACFFCSKKGHLAIDCPNKKAGVDCASELCLMCGNMGHDMFSCYGEYDPEDPKDVQCYICEEFGHLRCVDSTTEGETEVCCSKYGQSGYVGSCVKSHGVSGDRQLLPLCSKCTEGGHSQQECRKHLEATSNGATTKENAGAPEVSKRKARKAQR